MCVGEFRLSLIQVGLGMVVFSLTPVLDVCTQQQEGKELTKEEKQRLRKEKKQQKKSKEKKDEKASRDSEKEKKSVSAASPAPQPPTQPPAQKGACYIDSTDIYFSLDQ